MKFAYKLQITDIAKISSLKYRGPDSKSDLEYRHHQLVSLVKGPAEFLVAEDSEVLQVWPGEGDLLLVCVHFGLRKLKP